MAFFSKLKKRDLTAGTYEGDVIPKKTKWVYSVSGMFRDALYAIVSGFLTNYIMYSGVLSTDIDQYNAQIRVINILFVVFLIWDGFNDPIFGFILEKCHLKSGKFRPWILIGGVLNSIVVALMFTIRPKGWDFVIFWAIIYFLWDTVFTLNDIGYWSMLPSMTSDEKQRNRITTLMNVFVSLGSFSMYAICSLLPGPGNYDHIYGYIAVPACVLFALSQISVFFFCKEKKRDPKQDEVSSKTKFKDLFLVLKKNKPLRNAIIALFFYQIGSSLLIGTGITYFYLLYGYGGNYGGAVSLVFTVMYVIGTFASQALFGALSKKFSKQKLLTMATIVALVGYALFFVFTVPMFNGKALAEPTGGVSIAYAFSGTMFLAYIPPLIFFAAQGVFYLVLLMMIQNSIEYNEYQYGERKESVIFSWRPLDVKLGSAVQKGLTYLFLFMTSLYSTAISGISSAESKMADIIASGGDAASAQQEAADTIDALIAGINTSQLVALGSIMIACIAVCLIASYLFLHFGYKLDEKEYARIVDELKKRHEQDEKEAVTIAEKPLEAAPQPSEAK